MEKQKNSGSVKIKGIIEKIRNMEIGGGTWSPRSGKLVLKSSGLWVGGHQKLRGVYELDADRLSELEFSQGDYIGYWKDKETGREWWDISRLYQSKAKAVKIARELGEIAIWDNEKKDEIRI